MPKARSAIARGDATTPAPARTENAMTLAAPRAPADGGPRARGRRVALHEVRAVAVRAPVHAALAVKEPGASNATVPTGSGVEASRAVRARSQREAQASAGLDRPAPVLARRARGARHAVRVRTRRHVASTGRTGVDRPAPVLARRARADHPVSRARTPSDGTGRPETVSSGVATLVADAVKVAVPAKADSPAGETGDRASGAAGRPTATVDRSSEVAVRGRSRARGRITARRSPTMSPAKSSTARRGRS